ncbi:MAG: SHOCT-like domain-containing protein [Thermus sp.]|uniref:SHOCT-like domain-containing protein n=1 Tax=Thermus sp. TaxID=275 RepID=UPI003D0A0853
MEEKRRVLEMVRAGEIGVEEALSLLEALEERPRTKGPAQVLRVRVHVYDEGKPVRVNVNLPLALAELLEAFLPQEAKLALAGRGVALGDLLRLVREGVPEGKLVEIAAEEEGHPVQILVEVA